MGSLLFYHLRNLKFIINRKIALVSVIGTVLLLFLVFNLSAQIANEPANNPQNWSTPYPPFQIVGNLYYVGTYDLASYLIVTEKGNILINTGLSNSLPLIKQNIKDLGFKFKDIKILLTMQAHYDHLGAMAAIKKETGAKFFANAAEADVLKSGGATDYELGRLGVSFEPIVPDKLLKNKSRIRLGKTKLTLLHHPGHTKGSCSYLFTVTDKGKHYRVLIANMPTIIVDKKFAEVTAYPSIEKDYAYTFQAMKNLNFDIWVAAHASQFNLHKKHQPGDAYAPTKFMDTKGYHQALEELQGEYSKKLQ